MSSRVPHHVAFIMDGNGRWATARGLPRSRGHYEGIRRVRGVIDAALTWKIPAITLYAFSTENWNRPSQEVRHIMRLLSWFLVEECSRLVDEGISLRIIGDKTRLSESIRTIIDEVETKTSSGTKLTLYLAISYGGRDELCRAAHRFLSAQRQLPSHPPSESEFSNYLDAPDATEIDLIIRTGGEQRISNFLLWQGAYAELIFLDQHWPDFDRALFAECIHHFSQRSRRFGRDFSYSPTLQSKEL